jgi:putative endonuclease
LGLTVGAEGRGAAAERFVAQRLASRGYEIVTTNYRARPGEIDIVALDGGILVLVEVKQRTGERYGSAEESVDRRKIQRILDTADVFVAEHPEYGDHRWRLDLVAITLGRDGRIERFNHIEDLIVD